MSFGFCLRCRRAFAGTGDLLGVRSLCFGALVLQGLLVRSLQLFGNCFSGDDSLSSCQWGLPLVLVLCSLLPMLSAMVLLIASPSWHVVVRTLRDSLWVSPLEADLGTAGFLGHALPEMVGGANQIGPFPHASLDMWRH